MLSYFGGMKVPTYRVPGISFSIPDLCRGHTSARLPLILLQRPYKNHRVPNDNNVVKCLFDLHLTKVRITRCTDVLTVVHVLLVLSTQELP